MKFYIKLGPIKARTKKSLLCNVQYIFTVMHRTLCSIFKSFLYKEFLQAILHFLYGIILGLCVSVNVIL